MNLCFCGLIQHGDIMVVLGKIRNIQYIFKHIRMYFYSHERWRITDVVLASLQLSHTKSTKFAFSIKATGFVDSHNKSYLLLSVTFLYCSRCIKLYLEYFSCCPFLTIVYLGL